MQIELNDKTILEVADHPVDLGDFTAFLVENNTSMVPQIGGRAAYISRAERGLHPTVTYVRFNTDGEPDLEDGEPMCLVLDEDVFIIRIS